MDDFFGYGTSTYDVLALSGALMTSREAFTQLGGLDSELGELALGREQGGVGLLDGGWVAAGHRPRIRGERLTEQ